MGVFDFLKVSQFKATISEQQQAYDTLKSSLQNVSVKTAVELEEYIAIKQGEVDQIELKIAGLREEVNKRNSELANIQHQLIVATEQIEMEGFGLYTPRYDFATSLGYKDKLQEIRNLQKSMIKDKTAVKYFDNWTVDGSKAKGRKMTNDNIRQILRSFNNECEAAINKVKFSNYESILKRIDRSFEQLNALNETNKVRIRQGYLQLKLNELSLAYEYELKKEQERDELREQRERERDEKKLQEEVRRAKRKIDKDISHYQQVIDELTSKMLASGNPEEKHDLQQQILDLSEQIRLKEEEKEEMDYRLAHARAGYAYIISNIGSFGEDIVKIGVTRRLNPYERIGELSSASVPFRFDIHALIFSYDAYGLEGALHKKFEDRRINAVNSRKEFFRISINEIKEALNEYKDLTVDFTEIAEAEEYRKSVKLREEMQK